MTLFFSIAFVNLDFLTQHSMHSPTTRILILLNKSQYFIGSVNLHRSKLGKYSFHIEDITNYNPLLLLRILRLLAVLW